MLMKVTKQPKHGVTNPQNKTDKCSCQNPWNGISDLLDFEFFWGVGGGGGGEGMASDPTVELTSRAAYFYI